MIKHMADETAAQYISISDSSDQQKAYILANAFQKGRGEYDGVLSSFFSNLDEEDHATMLMKIEKQMEPENQDHFLHWMQDQAKLEKNLGEEMIGVPALAAWRKLPSWDHNSDKAQPVVLPPERDVAPTAASHAREAALEKVAPEKAALDAANREERAHERAAARTANLGSPASLLSPLDLPGSAGSTPTASPQRRSTVVRSLTYSRGPGNRGATGSPCRARSIYSKSPVSAPTVEARVSTRPAARILSSHEKAGRRSSYYQTSKKKP
jgi:hypothetical protein